MVVVVLIGILAVVAMPRMGEAGIDRHVYQDASEISDLFREARAHAIGRGAAVLVTMDTSSGKGGVFAARESVGADPLADAGASRVPQPSCMTPTDWTPSSTSTNYYEFRSLNFDGSYESTNGIKTILYTGTASSLAAVTKANICFTPMGRAYLSTGADPSTGMFDGQAPMLSTLIAEVSRQQSNKLLGIARQVVVPPTGVTRLVSATSLLP